MAASSSDVEKLQARPNYRVGGTRASRRKAQARKKRNLRTIAEITAEAAAHGVRAPHDIGSLPDIMDEVLRRAVGHFRFAAAMVDSLDVEDSFTRSVDAQGNTVWKEHWWIQAERACREEVAELAGRMSGLDIDARRVAVAEAQAALMMRAMQTAIETLKLTPAQRKELGPALRQARALLTNTPDPTNEDIEGTATAA